MDDSLPGSSVQEVFQAWTLEWVAISCSRRSSWPRDQTRVSCISCTDRQILHYYRHLGSPNIYWVLLTYILDFYKWLWSIDLNLFFSYFFTSIIFVGNINVTSKCFLVCHGIHSRHFTYPLPPNPTTTNRVVITIFVLVHVCTCLILLLFSWSVISDSLWPHGLQHARLPCPSSSPGTCSNSCPSNQWCHPTILSSVIPFSSCLQSFPASGSFPMSWLFTSGSQSTGASASASVFPMNIQGWFFFSIDWCDLLAVQGTLKSIFQHHSSKASIVVW